jgi:Ku protein
MRAEKMAGLGRVMLSSRERPILVTPFGNGLIGVTLRFAHEVRSEPDYFADIPEMVLPSDMLKLAKHIIETKAADFDPAMLEDHYRNALVDILRKKQASQPAPSAPVKPSPENVVSLMDALRRSLAAERPLPKPTPRRKPSAPKPVPSRRAGSRARKAG